MKYIYQLIFLSLFNLILIHSLNQTGLKLAIKQDVLLNFEKKILPQIIKKLGVINIEDKEFVEAKVTIKITNNQIKLDDISPNSIRVTFVEPNKLKINIENISASGSMDVNFKLVLSESDHVNIKITKLQINGEFKLITTESKKENGKLIPSAELISLVIDLDFDFEIKGSIIASIATIVKKLIFNYIKEYAKKKINELITAQSKEIISNLVEQIPIFIPIGSDLAIDFSLIDAPKILNDFIIINVNGAVVNINNKKTNLKPQQCNLPAINPKGKQVQSFIPDFTLITLLDTAYKNGLLDISFNSDEIKNQINIKVIGSIIDGIVNRYGSDLPVNIRLRITSPPKLVINNSIKVELDGEISFQAVLNSGATEDFLTFSSHISLNFNGNLSPGGQFKGQISNVKLKNLVLIKSFFKFANVIIEKLVNTATTVCIPIINRKLAQSLVVKLPTIFGITLDDSNIDIHSNFIEIDINPQFHDLTSFLLLESN